MIETSTSTAKLDSALAKAQGEIEAAAKDAVNPHFNKKYADLSSVWAAIRPALSKHGISVTQWPIHSEDNRLHMVTRLAHDGEYLMARFSVPVEKQNAHGYGSATTYAKRYCLAAAIGVVADEDDDGNEATKRAPHHDRAPHIQSAPPPEKKPPTYERSPIVRAAFERLQKGFNALRDIGNVEDVQTYWKDNKETIKGLPADWKDEITKLADEILEAIDAKAA